MWGRPGDCLHMAKIYCDFFGHYKCDKYQTLHDGSTPWALPILNTFCDLDHISGSQQCQTVLTENFVLFSDKVETLYDCWLRQVDHEMFKGSNGYVSSFEKKKNVTFFWNTVKARSFKLHDYNLASGLHFCCKFDELDFVSRSQVCQKYKLQLHVLDSCPL